MDDTICTNLITDSEFATAAIDRWKQTVQNRIRTIESAATGNLDIGDFENLKREIVKSIRAAKKQTVESCGLAYYEVKKDDQENIDVLIPILMDPRRVVLQFIDEKFGREEIPDTLQKWIKVLRPKTEYSQTGCLAASGLALYRTESQSALLNCQEAQTSPNPTPA